MKASSVLLAVFSGLAIAAPALDPRQNVDKLNAALSALNEKNTEVEKRIGTSVDEQAERHKQWKTRSTKQVELIKKAKDVLDELADLIKIAAQKADEAPDRLDKQEERREADNQDYVNIANDFKAAIKG
ncbi:hypothetical protein MGU_10093 [Metarhizium guizhouense ARSEF 977]|uniref:Uncharacterized protein n=1 Tax=Metarhizium guizhouense (strain ARSEF 977) TaxID=1276136 RepID=A0A0B4HT17_METGA|nr:hypothetical protein MGU_10093 [Metarhizium guizhouense ARSEF 977]